MSARSPDSGRAELASPTAWVLLLISFCSDTSPGEVVPHSSVNCLTLFHCPITTATFFFLEGLVDLCYCCSNMKVYSGFEEANWLWLILSNHAFPSARTITSVLFCHPYLPPWVLPCSQCCIPARRNFPLCCKCLVSGPAPDLAPAAHCMGSLQVSKQSALASQPLSISLQVKLFHCLLLTWPPILWI